MSDVLLLFVFLNLLFWCRKKLTSRLSTANRWHSFCALIGAKSLVSLSRQKLRPTREYEIEKQECVYSICIAKMLDVSPCFKLSQNIGPGTSWDSWKPANCRQGFKRFAAGKFFTQHVFVQKSGDFVIWNQVGLINQALFNLVKARPVQPVFRRNFGSFWEELHHARRFENRFSMSKVELSNGW